MNSRPSELHLNAATAATATVDIAPVTPAIRSDRTTAGITADLHPSVLGVVIASYLALLGIAWVAFVADIDTGIAMMVNTAYFAMYFGVPVVMARIGGFRLGGSGLATFLRSRFETFTGAISGWGAMTQMVVVPASLAFGLLAMGIILSVSA